MDELEETFGEEFAQTYEEQVKARRRQRESVSDEVKKLIANKAINENAFKQDNEPHFTFKTDEGITHDVLLMMMPDPQNEPIWNRVNKLDSGAATCPLDYMSEWMSCLFNDPDDLRRMDPGSYYIIIGNMSQWENEAGEVFDQVSPVRGVLSLDEARELADGELSDSGINESEPEPPEDPDEPEEEEEDIPEFGTDEPDDEEEEEDEEEDAGGFLGGGDDGDEEEKDESPVDKSEVRDEVEDLADMDDQVWEVSQDDPRMDKLTRTIISRLDYPEDDDTVLQEVEMFAIERIADYRNDEDEDDDEEDQLF